ncbi:oxidoreductase [Flavimaricola marinus]|uniref:4-formylbenzenesulfonate dehydrogenase TsaC1/TsaC2 n=1 Tax=Flavimaricola marinus TaxID=1819565 RepID=A0A238LB86_9RHOB|nr:oxidoreductase [Flavimaricola marinus]SMY06180.1 4-formylbenzenesulfonate dehydrogenase TsaC1/TsaC2 [Flavimaricola marinus]
MEIALSNKVVVVTGAATGIGAAVARRLAGAGVAGLLLTDRDTDGLARMSDSMPDCAVRYCVADLADKSAPAAIAHAAIVAFGRIDGLVNAAGLTSRARVTDGSVEVWDELFTVNARAAFFLMQAAIRDMLSRRAPGEIVNILSVNAHCGAPDLSIYSASKAALSTLTKNAAHAHLADRIRVNGINLGWVDTPSERHLQAVTLGRGDGWLAEESAKMPLGRLMQPDDPARLALYLLSDASAPMTGVAVDLEQRVTGAPV